MIGTWLVDHASPRTRLVIAAVMFDISLFAWPSTHVLMVVTDPAENSWVFHVLIAISWLAITWTSYDILQTSDIRENQEE